MKRSIFLLLLAFSSLPLIAQQEGLTYYELSGGKRTPRYNETIDYCLQLADASPMIHYTTFGVSPQGRDLPLLIVDKDGLTNPAEIKACDRLILLVEACIHPGESEGKDAGLMLIRDLITKDEGRGTKDKDQSTGLRAQGSQEQIEHRTSKIYWTTSPSFSSPSSTWTGMSGLAPTTGSTRTGRKRWGGV